MKSFTRACGQMNCFGFLFVPVVILIAVVVAVAKHQGGANEILATIIAALSVVAIFGIVALATVVHRSRRTAAESAAYAAEAESAAHAAVAAAREPVPEQDEAVIYILRPDSVEKTA